MEENKLNLIKINKSIPQEIDVNTEGMEVYLYKINDMIIGYALVKNDSSNIDNIFIKIFDRYQSNGYGSKLFIEVLDVLRSKKFEEIIINVDISNYKMINIINRSNCFELSNIDGVKKFLINLK